MLVVLGKTNIHKWANGGSVLRDAARVHVHPSYEQNTANNDVALIELNTEVPYTEAVRPICLWVGDDALEAVLGTTGVVAGWGRDETGADVVEEPRKVRMPIVSQEECLRSNRAFFSLTGDKTFCAGELFAISIFTMLILLSL